jgi:integrase
MQTAFDNPTKTLTFDQCHKGRLQDTREDQMTDLIITPPVDQLATLDQQVRDYADQSRAANTRAAYRSDWRHFCAWCAAAGLDSLPAESATVARYIAASAAQYAVATIERRLVSISQAHKLAGFEPSPTASEVVRSVMKGIRRQKGTAQKGAAPATVEVLRAMLDTLAPGLLGVRDRALLLLGFAGAFRRSELVSLHVADVQFTTVGAVVTLRRSKTDQEGASRKIGIPKGTRLDTCPVRALRAWLDAAVISEGAIFRAVDRHGHVAAAPLTGRSVDRIVKRAAAAAGLDAAAFSGHSLRAGLATAAAAAGASERSIMQQTGHKSERMVRRYIRDGELFRENAAAIVGL